MGKTANCTSNFQITLSLGPSRQMESLEEEYQVDRGVGQELLHEYGCLLLLILLLGGAVLCLIYAFLGMF